MGSSIIKTAFLKKRHDHHQHDRHAAVGRWRTSWQAAPRAHQHDDTVTPLRGKVLRTGRQPSCPPGVWQRCCAHRMLPGFLVAHGQHEPAPKETQTRIRSDLWRDRVRHRPRGTLDDSGAVHIEHCPKRGFRIVHGHRKPAPKETRTAGQGDTGRRRPTAACRLGPHSVPPSCGRLADLDSEPD